MSITSGHPRREPNLRRAAHTVVPQWRYAGRWPGPSPAVQGMLPNVPF
jgi:hypothetical protein